MPSVKDLRKRISSVRNTQQTTRAMKMVSAAKLRRAQEAIIHQRPYAKQLQGLFSQLSVMPGLEGISPLIAKSGPDAETQPKKLLLLLVSSDRGLCGAFNGNVVKLGLSWAKEHQKEYESIEYAFIGRKAYEYFRSRKLPLGPYMQELGGKVSYAKAKKLASNLIETYLGGKVDEVKIVYNEFKNVVMQRPVVENFLPFWDRGLGVEIKEGHKEVHQEAPIYLLRPSLAALLDDLLSRHFSAQCFRILLESQSGEHGARMSAMENATKNAEEMIKKLTLQYNKQRQAGITKELLEITAGSESQKG